MMKAAVLTTNGFEIQTITNPTIGADEVLVKTVACGVCSGDVFVYQNRETMAADYSRLGHEASGVVAAVGENVTAVQVGDTVTALALPAYADYFTATAEMLVKLPDDVDPNLALGEALACCVHAAGRFGIQKGDRVAVIGCGFMGLICLQLANYQGAGFVCAIDPTAERLEMAQRFGAHAIYDPTSIRGAEILAAHGEFDVVIEAAGVQNAIDLCTELVTLHGRIVLVGYHQSNNGLRTVNMERWNYKAIDVVNGHVRREDEKAAAMQEAVDLLAAGHLETEPLVTIYPFEQTEQAFRDLTSRKHGLFKAVLHMG